jgi:molybdopterin-guanine dinucleotide biosynthesis protein B
MTPLLPIPVVAVVGSRHSGKTTTTEAIVKGLASKGYRVATAKHIHQPNFTIDTEGRDTWRHAKAGAQTVTVVSENELATIEKVDTTKFVLNDITGNCGNSTDVMVIEGFRGLVAQDATVPKVVTAKNKAEINEALRVFKPILAFSTLLREQEIGTSQIPLVDVRKKPEKLVEIVDARVSPIIRKRRETQDSVDIEINGEALPLNPYVQKVTRNVLLSIVSTLKGTNIKGNENIQITITNTRKQA